MTLSGLGLDALEDMLNHLYAARNTGDQVFCFDGGRQVAVPV
jgi:hypothetical protein